MNKFKCIYCYININYCHRGFDALGIFDLVDGVFNLDLVDGVFSFDFVIGVLLIVVDGAFNLDAGVLMSLDDGVFTLETLEATLETPETLDEEGAFNRETRKGPAGVVVVVVVEEDG